VLNPNNYFRKNFDQHSLEVIDEYNVPMLQIRCLTLNSFKIGGVFRSERHPTSSLYPQFPSATDCFGGVFAELGPDQILIIGSNATALDGWPKTPDEVQALIGGPLKKYLAPWFDYSRPDLFGKHVS
jgi:hypothetical protein